MSKITSKSKASIQVRSIQQGGTQLGQPINADDMTKKAMAFAAQVAGGKAVPYEVLLQDYRTLDLPVGPTWVDLQNAREILQDLWILA